MEKQAQQNNTDLKNMLQHIDTLLTMTLSSVNSVSGQLLSVATAMECISLSQKLQRTLDRWRVYLPFREAHDVNFKWWVGYLSDLHKRLNDGSDIQPAPPYNLDYIDMLDSVSADADDAGDDAGQQPLFTPRYADSELQSDVREYVQRLDEQLERITDLSADEEQEWSDRVDRQSLKVLRQQYTDYLRLIYTSRAQYTPQQYQEEVVPQAISYLKTIANQPVMAYCLDMALSTLLDTLRQIDDLFSRDDISDEQLLRLSLRLYYRHCHDADQAASKEIHRKATAWPLRYRRDRAIEMREQLIARLRRSYQDPMLQQYIDIERPCPLTDPEFGRFLFASRHLIGISDVKALFSDCFRIHHLNRLIDPLAAEADINACQLNQQRKQVYARLKQLVQQAHWLGGMTAERVLSCFAQLLLPQPSRLASSQPSPHCEIFWGLLTCRRGCEDGFRSLKLTWLNLLGYFISRGVLKGGNKSLCNQFFPNGSTEGKYNENDRNHINKGADHRAPYDFQQLRPELDRILGLEEPQKSATKVKRK